MKKIIHPAKERGHQNHGWLKANHSFSFANFFDPQKIQFGALRVLNDDHIAAGMGFGTHPHDNMEIITLPLEGDLAHKDSMGHGAIIQEGDVQVISAGTGIYHSEVNPNKDQHVALLQIWIFPNQKDVTPRYQQMSIRDLKKDNEFYQILSPNAEDAGVWIHQNSWMHFGDFSTSKTLEYTLKDPSNGVYAFQIEGKGILAGEPLHKRDAIGIMETSSFQYEAEANSRILLIEVPLNY